MKKSIYILGMFCLSVILIGAIFKTSHLPGASKLLLIGISLMGFVFIPLTLKHSLKSTDDKLLRFVYVAAAISFGFDFISMLFKILHWPGASLLMIIGVPLPFVLFLPAYITYHNKRKLKTNLSFFGILLFMIYLGVFSALLALDTNANIYKSHSKISSSLTKTNEFLEANNPNISKECDYALKQINNLKRSLILHCNEGNKDFIYPDGKIDYDVIYGMRYGIGYHEFHECGLTHVNSSLTDYFNSIETTDSKITMLINDIESYRIQQSENEQPVIIKLPLGAALNILTEWQNKILLIEFLRKNII